jgi:erythromycin esterase-like protein
MSALDLLHHEARPIRGTADAYDGLLELIGDARLVLLGEASHGSHEFYRERARITRRLVEERGFEIVAVEGPLFSGGGATAVRRGGAFRQTEAVEPPRRRVSGDLSERCVSGTASDGRRPT